MKRNARLTQKRLRQIRINEKLFKKNCWQKCCFEKTSVWFEIFRKQNEFDQEWFRRWKSKSFFTKRDKFWIFRFSNYWTILCRKWLLNVWKMKFWNFVMNRIAIFDFWSKKKNLKNINLSTRRWKWTKSQFATRTFFFQ